MPNCERCGGIVRQGRKYCPACNFKLKSEAIDDICELDAFTRKQGVMAIYPYCKEKERRILIGGGKWICHNCEYYKGDRGDII